MKKGEIQEAFYEGLDKIRYDSCRPEVQRACIDLLLVMADRLKLASKKSGFFYLRARELLEEVNRNELNKK